MNAIQPTEHFIAMQKRNKNAQLRLRTPRCLAVAVGVSHFTHLQPDADVAGVDEDVFVGADESVGLAVNILAAVVGEDGPR